MPQNPSNSGDAETLALMSELQQSLTKHGISGGVQPQSSAQSVPASLSAQQSSGAQGTSPQPATGMTPTAQPASAPSGTAQPSAPVSALSSYVQGLTDLPAGIAQFEENIPGVTQGLNGVRWAGKMLSEGTAWGANKLGMHNVANAATDAALGFAPETAAQFNQIVNQREADYENARTAAGQTGIDWWRIAGDVVDPANYVVGAGDAAATFGGRLLSGAGQGALVGAMQPANTSAPGGFWWQKVKGAIGGAFGGGVAGAMTETLMPGLRAATSAILGRFGHQVPTGAAESIVNKAMADKGLNPASVSVPTIRAMKDEVQDALNAGGEPNATSITNRLKAESLPVPVKLTRGQASRDSMQFSQEQNLAKLDPRLNERLVQQNQAFLDNLDALGAKDAPDYVTTGNYLQEKLNNLWNQTNDQKNALYAAVRNNQGQSAHMDGLRVAQDIREVLDSPEASHSFQLLPGNIRQTVADLEDGKLNLTVAQMQTLDHTWGQQAAGTADGSVRNAIYQARDILGNARVDDDMGADARQAYQKAKAAHAQQMSLINPKLLNGRPNPKFQPLMKAVVDGKPPEGLYSSAFSKAPASVAAKNLAFMRSVDPDAPNIISKTLMGEIKRSVTGDAKEAPVVSEAKLRTWADEPGNRARLNVLMSRPQHDTFQNLVDTVENAKKFPVAHGVNTSNSGTFLASRTKDFLKRSAVAQIGKRAPFFHAALEGANVARTERDVQNSLNPGVTLKALLGGGPRRIRNQSLVRRLITPAIVVGTQQSKKSNGSGNEE